MAKKTVKEFIKEQMPDMEIVDLPPTASTDSVMRSADSLERDDRPGPSMAALRRKYLGADAADENGADDVMAAASANDDEGDIKVKYVRQKNTSADPADDPGPRAVIVSTKKGIIGAQG